MTSTQSLLFDIESTGLLRQGSRMHCIVMRDIDNPEKHEVYDHRESQTITMGVERLKRADALIGHNIIEYDLPLIKETHEFEFEGEIVELLFFLVFSILTLLTEISKGVPTECHSGCTAGTVSKPGDTD